MNFRSVFELICSAARFLFDAQGDHEPMLHLVAEDGAIMRIRDAWEGPESEVTLGEAIQGACFSGEVYAVITVGLADRISEQSPHARDPETSRFEDEPGGSPEGATVLMIEAEGVGGEELHGYYEIDIAPNGRRQVGAFHRLGRRAGNKRWFTATASANRRLH